MIGGNTVFIVGAGASYELGLPVGDELKTIIAGLLNITFNDGYTRGSGDGAITQALREIVKDGSGRAGDINPYLHKCWRIRDALPMAISIDNFLDAHRGDTQMELCGKFGIVRAILEAERASKLKIFQNPRGEYQFSTLANTWYIPLFQLITENVDRNRIKSVFQKLSFIVFNYDRCLEYFLPFAISNYYDISLPDAEALVAQITFIHPYGQVGYLPWQKDGPKVPFGADRYDIPSIAREIRTFTQGLSTPSLKKDIGTAIYESENIVFLGFCVSPHKHEYSHNRPPASYAAKRLWYNIRP